MYLGNFGQVETQQKTESAQNIEAIAKLTSAIAEPATDAYIAHVRAEINIERIKAGLPPLGPITLLPPPPSNDNFVIGGIALLVVIFLLLSKS